MGRNRKRKAPEQTYDAGTDLTPLRHCYEFPQLLEVPNAPAPFNADCFVYDTVLHALLLKPDVMSWLFALAKLTPFRFRVRPSYPGPWNDKKASVAPDLLVSVFEAALRMCPNQDTQVALASLYVRNEKLAEREREAMLSHRSSAEQRVGVLDRWVSLLESQLSIVPFKPMHASLEKQLFGFAETASVGACVGAVGVAAAGVAADLVRVAHATRLQGLLDAAALLQFEAFVARALEAHASGAGAGVGAGAGAGVGAGAAGRAGGAVLSAGVAVRRAISSVLARLRVVPDDMLRRFAGARALMVAPAAREPALRPGSWEQRGSVEAQLLEQAAARKGGSGGGGGGGGRPELELLEAMGVRRGPLEECSAADEVYVLRMGAFEVADWFYSGGAVPSPETMRSAKWYEPSVAARTADVILGLYLREPSAAAAAPPNIPNLPNRPDHPNLPNRPNRPNLHHALSTVASWCMSASPVCDVLDRCVKEHAQLQDMAYATCILEANRDGTRQDHFTPGLLRRMLDWPWMRVDKGSPTFWLAVASCSESKDAPLLDKLLSCAGKVDALRAPTPQGQ